MGLCQRIGGTVSEDWWDCVRRLVGLCKRIGGTVSEDWWDCVRNRHRVNRLPYSFVCE